MYHEYQIFLQVFKYKLLTYPNEVLYIIYDLRLIWYLNYGFKKKGKQ